MYAIRSYYGVVAARGVFHFQFFDTGGFDLYAGIHTGIRFYNYVYDDIDNFYDYSYNDAVITSYSIHYTKLYDPSF